jgi:hypothetical protein
MAIKKGEHGCMLNSSPTDVPPWQIVNIDSFILSRKLRVFYAVTNGTTAGGRGQKVRAAKGDLAGASIGRIAMRLAGFVNEC